MRKFNFRKFINLAVNKISNALERTQNAASNMALKFGLVGKGSSQKLVVTFEVTTTKINNLLNTVFSEAYDMVDGTTLENHEDSTFKSGMLYCMSTIAKILEESDETHIQNLLAVGAVQFEEMVKKYSNEEYDNMNSERKARIFVEELSNLLLVMEKPDNKTMMM